MNGNDRFAQHHLTAATSQGSFGSRMNGNLVGLPYATGTVVARFLREPHEWKLPCPIPIHKSEGRRKVPSGAA